MDAIIAEALDSAARVHDLNYATRRARERELHASPRAIRLLQHRIVHFLQDVPEEMTVREILDELAWNWRVDE